MARSRHNAQQAPAQPPRPDYQLRAQWGGKQRNVPDNYQGELALTRVALDDGGYDAMGRYYGPGAPLFLVEHTDPEEYHKHGIEIIFHVRAKDRTAAKALVRRMYPTAKIA